MGETLTDLVTRRSVRSYKPEQIKENELNMIIEAGQFAPSARNDQPWHFTVIQNKEILNKINGIIKQIFLNSGNDVYIERAKVDNFSPFYHAPTLIIVSAKEQSIAPHQDGALALGNFFLAAHALGIGSVWIHSLRSLFDSEEGKELNKELNIPEGHIIVGSGAFGYNAGSTPQAAPRKEGTVTFIK